MEVTAKNMKILSTKDSDEIKKVLKDIKEQAELGKTSLFIYGVIEDTTKIELESRGFKVEIGGRYNEKDTNISW